MANPGKDFSNKILTSARNGEIMTWDLNRNNNVKYGTRRKLLICLSFSHFRPKNDERAIIHVRDIGCRTRPSSIITAFQVPRTVTSGYG